jgi:hypothetical protein
LTHNCAVLGMTVDPAKLFYGDDPEYEFWLGMVVDRVHATQQEADRRARAG